MKSRLIVAAIGIPIVYLLLWIEWNRSLLFAVLVAIAVSIAVLEFYEMMREYRPYVPAGLLAVGLTPLLAWRGFEPGIFAGMLIAIPLTMIFALLSAERQDQAASVAMTLCGVGYIAIAGGLIVVLRASPHGFDLVLLMLAGIWATDTGAFLVGKSIGRHKLAPRISPGKTIEGFVGGSLLGVVVIWYGHFLTGREGSAEHWLSGREALVIGIAIAISTPVGDLFESMLKRSVGVKDSGRLLGDHGGMLDRLDALFVAVPVMYLACFLVGVL